MGAVETLRLLDTDTVVPSLGRVDVQVWRDRLTSPGRLDGLDQRLRMVEESGIATLIPGDAHWPRALDDLGERAPYVLFVRGATSFLAQPLNDLVTVTGSRAPPRMGSMSPPSWLPASRTGNAYWSLGCVRCRSRGAPCGVGGGWGHDRGARRWHGPPLPERES